jgi:kinetochore protein NDC80
LDEKRNKLTSGPSRPKALEADKVTFESEDDQKFESVVKTWSSKVSEKEDAIVNLQKGVEVTFMDAERLVAENQNLVNKVRAQTVNVRDADRMHREMQLVQLDIAKLESEKATMEDKGWELDAALVSKLSSYTFFIH